MALTQPPRKRTRVWPTTVVGMLALLTALLALPLTLAPRAEGYVYWTNHDTDTIGRANLDGTNADQSFITRTGAPVGIAVDAEHVYWANDGGTIGRAELDGTRADQGFISPGAGTPQGVAVDANHVYWADFSTDTIGRANLDGTNVDQSFISGASDPVGVAVDATHIYWANFFTNAIGRANLDGTGVSQSFIGDASSSNGSPPTGVAVDAGHVYWGAYGLGIGRANLDGSGVNPNFVTGTHTQVGIAVDDSHIYWVNFSTNAIGRANLDGTDANQSFIGARRPYSVAVDSGNPGPPPEITELRLSPKAFAADPALTPLARASRTQIKVGLSKDAKVHFRVRHDPPRAHGGPAPEYPHVFRRQLDKGQDSVSFTATLGKRTFSPGRYLLIARARDSADQASERVSAKFRIKD